MPAPGGVRAYLPFWIRDTERKLKRMLSGFASWLCILSGVIVVCGLVVLIPAFWTLDRQSYSYLQTLFGLSWRAFLGGLGTTTRGFVSALSVSAISGFVALLIIFPSSGESVGEAGFRDTWEIALEMLVSHAVSTDSRLLSTCQKPHFGPRRNRPGISGSAPLLLPTAILRAAVGCRPVSFR